MLHGSIRRKPIVKDSALLPITRMDVVSVPLWPVSLSGRLRIIGLGMLSPSQLPNPKWVPRTLHFVFVGIKPKFSIESPFITHPFAILLKVSDSHV